MELGVGDLGRVERHGGCIGFGVKVNNLKPQSLNPNLCTKARLMIPDFAALLPLKH